MPVVNKNNITLGLGNLEFGDYVTTGPVPVFQGYHDVGAIKSELSVEINREIKEFETGRPLIVILQECIRESVMVKCQLAEMAMATIKESLGQGVITTGTTSFLDGTNTALGGTLAPGYTPVVSGTLLQFGGVPTHAFVGLRFTHLKADGNRQIFEGYYASPTGALTLPFRETDWSVYDVTFRLLANTALPAGQQYFQFFKEGSA